MGQTLVLNSRRKYTLQCRDQSPLLGMQCHSVVDGAGCGIWLAGFLTFKQALELGGHVRKGERGTRVYFVKQLQIQEDAEGDVQRD